MKTISDDRLNMLIKRKNEMLKLIEEGYEFKQYNSDFPDMEQDIDLAYHHLVSNLIIELTDLREETGLTQAEVAAKMGTKQTAISRFERYNTKPTLEFINKYAWALGAKLLITPHGKSAIVLKETHYRVMEELAYRRGVTINQEFITAVVEYAVAQPSYVPMISFGSIPISDQDKIDLRLNLSNNSSIAGAV